MVHMEFTTTFPKENAIFSMITGTDKSTMGRTTRRFKEMLLKEKENAFPLRLKW